MRKNNPQVKRWRKELYRYLEASQTSTLPCTQSTTVVIILTSWGIRSIYRRLLWIRLTDELCSIVTRCLSANLHHSKTSANCPRAHKQNNGAIWHHYLQKSTSTSECPGACFSVWHQFKVLRPRDAYSTTCSCAFALRQQQLRRINRSPSVHAAQCTAQESIFDAVHLIALAPATRMPHFRLLVTEITRYWLQSTCGRAMAALGFQSWMLTSSSGVYFFFIRAFFGVLNG